MAPATELGRDDPETRRTSMVDLLGFPSRSSHPHPDLDHNGWAPSGSPFDDVRDSFCFPSWLGSSPSSVRHGRRASQAQAPRRHP